MRRLWVVAYDIADDRTRLTVQRRLAARGERVQWSVYECWLDRDAQRVLRKELAELTDAKEDSVRWYPLCTPCRERSVYLGVRGGLPEADYFVV